ncbi:hypothetical protein ACFW84_01405 [Streptomyces anulatus]|uniref:hypothetical protein n=1 Tax=Streptomyces anulatus TaxID=1892 RepID=UPI0036814996
MRALHYDGVRTAVSGRRSTDPDEQGSQPLTHVPSLAARRERPAGGAHGPGQDSPDTPGSSAGAAAARDIAVAAVTRSDKALAAAAGMARVRHQMGRIARGGDARPRKHPAYTLLSEQWKQHGALRRYRAWLAASQGAETMNRPA